VPADRRHPRRPGISVHRRTNFATTTHRGIAITSPACTLTDLATRLSGAQLERAVNEAANRDLIDPEKLRAGLDRMPRRPGLSALRAMLDRDTFAITDSRLEQRFLRIARRAGLPPPQTQTHLNGCRVDFYWPGLGLVVETDSLRYHRTPAQQASDRRRDHAHVAAGLTPLRFTHAQVWFDADHVEQTLRSVASAPRRRASA
jgi:very-short-patch-repair endonuclease